MHRPTIAVVFLSLVAGTLSVARGQATIPDSLMTAQTLSSAQMNTIRNAAQLSVQQMVRGSDEQVAQGRRQLLGYYQQAQALGGTAVFFDALSDAIAGQLATPMQADRVVCRLNAMLVSSRVLSRNVVGLVVTGLNDPSPAVRYAAAQAIISLAQLNEGTGRNPQTDEPVLTDADFNRWVAALTAMLSNESSQPVIRAAALAMAQLPVQQAREQTLAILQSRLDYHRDHPTASMAGDSDALRSVYLFEAQNGTFNNAATLARIALQYLSVASSQMRSGNLPASQQTERENVIQVAEAVVRYLASNGSPLNDLIADQSTRSKLAQAIQSQDWLQTELFAETLLTKVPAANP